MTVSKTLILITIFTVGMLYVLSNSSLNTASATLEIQNSTGTMSYVPYTDSKIGISFEYPSNWTLDPKTDRFSTGPDLEVSRGFNSFKVVDHEDRLEDSIKFFDLEFVAENAETSFLKEPGARSIEGVDTDTYKIDGKDTASFLYATKEPILGIDFDFAQQIFMVNNDGHVVTFGYQDTVSKFDTPKSQEMMNHIINSIKFIDSENNDESEEDSDEEEGDSN